MAKRPKYLQELDPVPPVIERHLTALDFSNSSEYISWCRINGFKESLTKSRSDLQEELTAYETLETKREAQSRLHRNPKAFLESICTGQLTSDEIHRPIYKAVAKEIEESNSAEEVRASLLEMLILLMAKTDITFQIMQNFTETPFVRGLIKLHDRKALWLRDIKDWKPKSKNRERLFGELTHYLFDEFGDVPRFLEDVWLRNDSPSWRFRDWFIHLGRGYNLRDAKTIVPLTKKMAHHFRFAPDNYSAEQAIRWGQLRALGASEASINAVVSTQLGQSFTNEDFWFSVLRFISDNPMLDPRQIGPIIDYLQFQRFDSQEIEVEPGIWRTESAPQPNLSMNGRTVDTLLRQVTEWHDSFGKYTKLPTGNYKPALFPGFKLARNADNVTKHWTIRQLRNARDLQIEGEALKHCVTSYHRSCEQNSCTLWNLSVTSENGPMERRQTIEVDSNKTIVQCRGLANNDPNQEEWKIVLAWAEKENLKVSNFLH